MNSESRNANNSVQDSAIKFKKRSPVAAALLTLLVPGLGHYYCGEVKRGFFLFLIYLVYSTTFFALIKFIPGYAIALYTLLTCIPIGTYILIESIIIAIKNTKYKLQSFNKAKYYVAIIVTSIYYVSPITDIFSPGIFTTATGSMLNTVLPGDRFFDNDLYYGIKNPFTGKYAILYNKPQAGDIVNFIYPGLPEEAPPKETTNYFKRILAVPGDSFVINNRIIKLNDKYCFYEHFYFDEKFAFLGKEPNPSIFPKGSGWNVDNYGPIKVPKAGDKVSFDTSSISLWKRIIRDEGNKLEIIKDRIFINDIEKYSYIFKDNYYFMIGDNWYNSLDSRYFGFVNENDIDSKITMIYFSWDRDIPLKDTGRKLRSIRWDRIGKMIE
ncbi:MAG: S26 family signal peptidase [Ignavibacteria bacterium]|nr:S26 family signal peptidase [Ignavibacteria bacterium]